MKINDTYESILSEFESGTLDIQDVLSTKEIQSEMPEFSDYIKINKIEAYTALSNNVENQNNDSY